MSFERTSSIAKLSELAAPCGLGCDAVEGWWCREKRHYVIRFVVVLLKDICLIVQINVPDGQSRRYLQAIPSAQNRNAGTRASLLSYVKHCSIAVYTTQFGIQIYKLTENM